MFTSNIVVLVTNRERLRTVIVAPWWTIWSKSPVDWHVIWTLFQGDYPNDNQHSPHLQVPPHTLPAQSDTSSSTSSTTPRRWPVDVDFDDGCTYRMSQKTHCQNCQNCHQISGGSNFDNSTPIGGNSENAFLGHPVMIHYEYDRSWC